MVNLLIIDRTNQEYMTQFSNTAITRFSQHAIICLAVAGIMVSAPAFAADKGVIMVDITAPVTLKVNTKQFALVDSERIIPIINPISPINPIVPPPVVPPVSNNTPPSVDNLIHTLFNGAEQGSRGNIAVASLSVSFNDAVPQAGNGELANNMTIATVDPTGDGLLSYAVSDITVMESLAPAAGGNLDKTQVKKIMDKVYDQLIDSSIPNG
jgi:hypothetical protein